jgi:hypothetical protein
MYPLLLALLIGVGPAIVVGLIGVIVAIERRTEHLRFSVLASLGLLGIIGAKADGFRCG